VAAPRWQGANAPRATRRGKGPNARARARAVARHGSGRLGLALNTAMRKDEIRLLRWGQIDFENRAFIVGRSKTDAGTGGSLMPYAIGVKNLGPDSANNVLICFRGTEYFRDWLDDFDFAPHRITLFLDVARFIKASRSSTKLFEIISACSFNPTPPTAMRFSSRATVSAERFVACARTIQKAGRCRDCSPSRPHRPVRSMWTNPLAHKRTALHHHADEK
jgi:hypothetical protein